MLTECATWGGVANGNYILRYNEKIAMIRIPEHIRWDLIRSTQYTYYLSPIEPSFRRVILAKKKRMQVELLTQWRGSNVMDFSQILCAGLVLPNRVWGGRDETGWDGTGWACGPHTRKGVHLSIHLSIYLLIEPQSRLKFNGPTDPSLHTTSCFPGWGYKRQMTFNFGG